MQIKKISVSQINRAKYNPRRELKPGDAEYERLAKSLDSFGLVEPLVVNERTGNLVGGHQRLSVLVARGATEVDVSVVDLPLEREKALNLALNKISGEWDAEKLAALLDELVRDATVDLDLTGFERGEADAIIADHLGPDLSHQEEAFDLAAELAKIGTPITKRGDLIVLGTDPRLQHALLCGDCTDAAQVRRLIRASGSGGGENRHAGNAAEGGSNGSAPTSERAVLFATDPPYLVDYSGTNHPPSRKDSGQGKNKNWSATYGVTWDDAAANPELYEKFIRAAVDEAIRPDAAWYCWHASKRQAMVENAWTKAGAFVHCQIIWSKNRSVLTRTWFAWQHEPCFMGWVQGRKPPRNPDAPSLSTVWNIDTLPNGDERPDHPTPKPLEVFEYPMLQHTKPGELCFEPFAGSGTQIIAAQRLKRRCAAIEISPIYCDLIVRRFIAFAGKQAVTREIAKKYATNK